jgi:hypothetical protein
MVAGAFGCRSSSDGPANGILNYGRLKIEGKRATSYGVTRLRSFSSPMGQSAIYMAAMLFFQTDY